MANKKDNDLCYLKCTRYKINEATQKIKELNFGISVLTEPKRKGQVSENLGYDDQFYTGISKDQKVQRGLSILIRKKKT